MTKRLIIVLDDPDTSNTEHYLDLLAEDLEKLLATKNLKLVDLKETKSDSNESG